MVFDTVLVDLVRINSHIVIWAPKFSPSGTKAVFVMAKSRKHGHNMVKR